ncbi:UNVERIFIED_CONTAM: hypothetical protein Sradi_6915700 [Sesamum radiatum]|uniref:Reverse transcriptase/retrotransposon-derived protein RNase H-like domain-containing protein n=1 Tax=Sesamum radiatum TaxID=300843 RepID=A0AAW2JHJ2_SESRA
MRQSLESQVQTVIFTKAQEDEDDDKESVAAFCHISCDDEIIKGEVATTYHTTLSEEASVEEEDVEITPTELEEDVKTTVDELKEINLSDVENPRPIYISALLIDDEEETYVEVLHEFKDVFTWSYKDMPGLDPKVAAHQLSIRKGARPVKQAQCRFRSELVPLIEIKVNKLIEVGFIREGVPFEWDEACRNAFRSIKSYLMKPPVLVAPVPGRPLILYIAAQECLVGALLVQENDEGKESALYYLSRITDS